jgi:hypothetical protein
VKKQRDLYQVMRVIERRYGKIGDTLLEIYLDSVACSTLLELLAVTDDEEEAARLNSVFEGIDLDAAAYGAWDVFMDMAKDAGLNGGKLWEQFSEADAYWGTNQEGWEEERRARERAPSYQVLGRLALTKRESERA